MNINEKKFRKQDTQHSNTHSFQSVIFFVLSVVLCISSVLVVSTSPQKDPPLAFILFGLNFISVAFIFIFDKKITLGKNGNGKVIHKDENPSQFWLSVSIILLFGVTMTLVGFAKTL